MPDTVRLPEVASTSAAPPAPAPLAAWWPTIVAHPGHLMIVGETQSGKRTTTRALLAEQAQTDRIIVLDPHLKFNQWPITPANSGRNFDEIERLLAGIHAEFERRFAPDTETGPPISVFVDELPAIILARPLVAEWVKQWAREAAKTGLRCVFLVQDPNVETLGIRGEGAVRENVRKVLLGGFAAKASPVAAAQERPAAVEWRGTVLPVSVTGLLVHAAQVVDPAVAWLPPAALEPPSDDLVWTAEHVRIATWLATEPAISTRELARRLFGDDGGGRSSVKAKALREQVEDLVRSTVPAVPPSGNGAEQRVREQGTPERQVLTA